MVVYTCNPSVPIATWEVETRESLGLPRVVSLVYAAVNKSPTSNKVRSEVLLWLLLTSISHSCPYSHTQTHACKDERIQLNFEQGRKQTLYGAPLSLTPSFVSADSSDSVFPRRTSGASPDHHFKMQILRLHPRPWNRTRWGWCQEIVFQKDLQVVLMHRTFIEDAPSVGIGNPGSITSFQLQRECHWCCVLSA